MGKVETIFKKEILRLAKKEVKATFLPLRKEVWAMKLKLSRLSKNFKNLDQLARVQIRENPNKLHWEPSAEEVKASRLTSGRIRNLRQKLGLSQRELALLTGVSMGAVALWEKGKFAPTEERKAALVGLRKLGKREVKNLLAAKAGEGKKRTPKKNPFPRIKRQR